MSSPFAKIAKRVEGYYQLRGVNKVNDKILDNMTIYTISPYKTGTTYLSSCFDQTVSKHEPMQYLSLLQLEWYFDHFFVSRLNTLNLKLECSGFWSGYIDELVTHEVAKDLFYICILRDSSSWATSVINYWCRSTYVLQRFDFINELFWKPKTGVDVRKVLSSNDSERDEMINKLLGFYLDFT